MTYHGIPLEDVSTYISDPHPMFIVYSAWSDDVEIISLVDDRTYAQKDRRPGIEYCSWKEVA